MAGFAAYFSGFYDRLSIIEAPIMAIGMMALSFVIVYQQLVIRRLKSKRQKGTSESVTSAGSDRQK
ncbi:hypothetical protein [Natranaeroarchaeum aerophilus]|uniref:Uncharacterized protein n=1 Tax=Natranaeroarchaeum aerophilus TaxID=2917711 RepID=A0AAE3FNP5_9EURY|nr:hypothetical protein [Natranaeroarchaeum aerophilus]MCL9812280.1 hypothetical protein [Natranaeroarchaeum aerophilus]